MNDIYTVNVEPISSFNTRNMYLFLYFFYLSLLQVNPVLQLSNSLQDRGRRGQGQTHLEARWWNQASVSMVAVALLGKNQN